MRFPARRSQSLHRADSALKAAGTQTLFIDINGFKPPEWILRTWFEAFLLNKNFSILPKNAFWNLYDERLFQSDFPFVSFGKTNLTMSPSTDQKKKKKTDQTIPIIRSAKADVRCHPCCARCCWEGAHPGSALRHNRERVWKEQEQSASPGGSRAVSVLREITRGLSQQAFPCQSRS